jgi:hypothetical protein
VEHSPRVSHRSSHPLHETITHGPNYQCPPPDLVDGEEEYSIEKILDSQQFGRRQCLQYLVKWEGYPDSDNMWVNKDDVFADDKVWDFKSSNPAKETHIRSLSSTKSPHPSALKHSHLLQQHTHRYMSSNGHSDLAKKLLLEHMLTPPLGMKGSHRLYHTRDITRWLQRTVYAQSPCHPI